MLSTLLNVVLEIRSIIWNVKMYLEVVVDDFIRKYYGRFPLGPIPTPWVRYPIFGLKPLDFLLKLKQNYGDIASVYLGRTPAIVLSNHDLIKEVLAIKECEGKPCRQQAKFHKDCFATIKQTGNRIDFVLNVETITLIEKLYQDRKELINSKLLFNRAIVNSLWTLIYGEPFEKDEDVEMMVMATSTKKDLLQCCFNRYAQSLDRWFPISVENFPLVEKYFPNFYKPKNSLCKRGNGAKDILLLVMKKLEMYLTALDLNPDFVKTSNPSLLKYWCQHLQQELTNCSKAEDVEQKKQFEKAIISSSMCDLLITGTETLSSALTWAVLYLVLHPDIQEEMFQEIKSVLTGSPPRLKDKDRMPFTRAVIAEVLRCASVIPLAISHHLTEDIDFHGYSIPKDTLIIGNLYATHKDKTCWEGDGDGDVYTSSFNPHRFIQNRKNKDGKITARYFESKSIEALFPFSFGEHSCVGSALAEDCLFMFVTAIFQEFECMPEPNLKIVETLRKRSCDQTKFVLAPKEFKFFIRHRSEPRFCSREEELENYLEGISNMAEFAFDNANEGFRTKLVNSSELW